MKLGLVKAAQLFVEEFEKYRFLVLKPNLFFRSRYNSLRHKGDNWKERKNEILIVNRFFNLIFSFSCL